MDEKDGYVVITLTGNGPTWPLISEKGKVVFTIMNCPKKLDALELAKKWASSWYNYKIVDGTDEKT